MKMRARKAKTKRVLSLLLALMMIISAAPVSGMNAFAAESGDYEYQVSEKSVAQADESAITQDAAYEDDAQESAARTESGDFEYRILNDGTAEITGYNGTASDLVIPSEIDGYKVTSIGYYAFRDNMNIVNAEIAEGIAKIGEWSFSGCTNLKNISVPESVTDIEMYAFENCTSLESITIPHSVTELSFYAFDGCTALTAITVDSQNTKYVDIDGVVFSKDITKLIIFPEGKGGNYSVPNGTVYIVDSVFNDNINLERISIPATVADLGNTPFSGCSALEYISVNADNPNYSSDNGALLTKDKTIIIDYPDAKSGSYNIPNTVKRIESYAFENACLDKAVIPESVREIGRRAFADCTSLADIDIADNVEFIEAEAFYKTAYYANQDNWENGILYLGNYLLDIQQYKNEFFNIMMGRISAPINIKDGTKVIADSAFEFTTIDSDSDFDIVIPDSVVTIGNRAFASVLKSNLISITIPASVKNLGQDVFKSDFERADIPTMNSNMMRLIGSPWSNVTFLGDVESVDSGMFYRCKSLKSIDFKGNVGSIKDSAFSSSSSLLSSLESVSFSGAVGEIGSSVFSGCTSLKNVVLPYNLTTIPDYMFNGCTSLETITIPSGVEKIGDYAFTDCSSLSDITLPDGVTYIGTAVLNNTAYYNESSNWQSGELYVGNYLIKISNELSGKYEVKDSVKAIAADVFTGCANLTEIVLPQDMLVIPNNLFEGCSSLKSVSIPESINKIGMYAFNGCSALKEIVIPAGVSSLEWGVFEDCTSLTDVVIPESVTQIKGRAFANCSSLKKIHIPNGVSYIGSEAFSGCSALADFEIPESVTYLGSDVFIGTAYYNDPSNWNDGILYIDNCLVSVSENFEGVCSINNNIKVIADGVFSYNDKITGVELPDSIKAIPDYMFVGCDSLKTASIPKGVKEIGEKAFDGCSVLESIILPDGVENIGALAFANCDAVGSVMIPDSVTNIDYCAFGYTGSPIKGIDPVPGFKIYGYAGTAAETYAKENGFEFIALDKTVDSATGISVAEKELNILPDGAEIKAEQLSADDNKIVFDISLVKDGAQVQPSGELTVKIPVPEGMDGSLLKVYREEANGTYTDMNAYFADGYMVFTTDHFSKYILTTEEPAAVLKGDVNGDGAVDAADAVLVQRYDAGMITLSDTQLRAADVNSDGTVDAADAVLIMRLDAGLIDRL